MALILFYKEEAKKLITKMYEPADIVSKEFQFTTLDLTIKLMSILPKIEETDVYEALLELGFEPQEVNTLEYVWYFKRKLE